MGRRLSAPCPGCDSTVHDDPVVGNQIEQGRVIGSRPVTVGEEQQPGGVGLFPAGVVERSGTELLTALVEVDHQEVLAAFTAECQWEQWAPGFTLGRAALVLRCQVTGLRRFQSGVDGVALADELVQLEREQCPAAWVVDLRASEQQFTQALVTGLCIDTGQLAQLRDGRAQPFR
jgi:hypothetical protein